MRFIKLFVFLFLMAGIVSCGSQKRAMVNYIVDTDSTRINPEVIVPEVKIQKSDLLTIKVYSSSIDPSVDALYNLSVTGSAGGSANNIIERGFLVDENGNIQYPRLGTIHAEGLTQNQLADSIKTRLTFPVELLKNPTVTVRFLNFKITVLGEVGHPGSITIPTGRVTILEAIGLAGDIPLTGKKNTVRVLREVNGKREIGYIDLTSEKIFDSPYYNLLQNDVVIVEVTKNKIRQTDQIALQRVTTVLGIVTSLLVLYNVLEKF